MTFSPDGRWLASTHRNGTILVWNMEHRRREFSFDRHTSAVRAIAVSPDAKCYASAGDDRTIIAWNAETDLKEAVLSKHATRTRIINLLFSPDGRWLVSLDQDGRLIRWDIEGRKPYWETKVIMGTSCLAVSPDGKSLVTHQVVTDSNDGRECEFFPYS